MTEHAPPETHPATGPDAASRRPPAEEADVIVVGAGPAGATTAFYLAQSGLDVLVLEKSTFPREKVCGASMRKAPADYVALQNDGRRSMRTTVADDSLGRWRACCNQHKGNTVRVHEKINSAISP